jgi:aspartyl-tRNA(Asn)/glutamyl-tRNA(Gln) amidotransferase subunit C
MLASAMPGGSSDFDTRHLASLARLTLTPDEHERFGAQLDRILLYAAAVRNVDTTGVPPTTHVLAPALPERPDTPAPSLSQAEALANAPDPGVGLFRVPKVLGG